MNFITSMALWWFLLSSANIAAPPTLNLLGEITLINNNVIFYTKANCCETLCNFLLITTAALQGLNSHSKTENLVN